MNTATPSIAYLRTLRWVSLSNGFSLNGMITSCTSIVAQECRYVSCVLIKAASINAAKAPNKPIGSTVESTIGPRI